MFTKSTEIIVLLLKNKKYLIIYKIKKEERSEFSMCSNLKTTFLNIFKKSNIYKIISFFFSILFVVYLLREKNYNYQNLQLANSYYDNYITNVGIAYLKTLVIASIIILLIRPYFKDKRLDIISWFYPFLISIIA